MLIINCICKKISERFLRMTERVSNPNSKGEKKDKKEGRSRIRRFFVCLFSSFCFDVYCLFKFLLILFSSNRRVGGVKFAIHIPCWGEEYLNTLAKLTLPSLMASGNKIAAAKEGVGIVFTCSKSFKEKLEQFDIMKEVKLAYKVEYIFFSSYIVDFIIKRIPFITSIIYGFLGLMQYSALKLCRANNMAIVPFFPDIVVENEFIGKLLTLNKKYEVVFGSSFRSSLEKWKVYVEQRGYDDKGSLSFSGNELVDLQCKFIHTESINRLIAFPKRKIILTPQMLFRYKGHLYIKTYHWTPLVISSDILSKLRLSPVKTIDSYFGERYEKPFDEARCFFAENANELAWCEVSSKNKVDRIYKPDMTAKERKDWVVERLEKLNLSDREWLFLQKSIVYTPSQAEMKNIRYQDLNPNWLSDVRKTMLGRHEK